MYDELVKRLRGIARWDWNGGDGEYVGHTVKEAADAIETLSHENESLAKSVNEAAEMLHKWGTPPKGVVSMGVYIRGMEMPKNCDDCLLGSDCPHDQSIDGYKMQGCRPRTCPLTPVPPHGRLIDADALTTSTAVPLDGESYQYAHIDNIKAAPTIIPAEEGET